MTEEIDAEEEQALRALFASAVPSISDDGFSSGILRRIRAGIWRRRLLFAVASLAGLTIASPAITELLTAASQQLAGLVSPPGDASGAGLLDILLSVLPVRETIEGLSARLMDAGTAIESAPWFDQYRTLLKATLLALGSLAIPSLLER